MQELTQGYQFPYGWICLNRTWMCLNMSEFAIIDRVLNMYCTIYRKPEYNFQVETMSRNTRRILDQKLDNFFLKEIRKSRVCVELKKIWSYCTLINIKLWLASGYFRFKMSPTSGHCPLLFFFKNLFHRKNCKEAMNIGGGQISGALFNFFVVKKWSFLHLPDAALSFYNNPWKHMFISV